MTFKLTCPICGKVFESTKRDAKFCSQSCHWKAINKRKQEKTMKNIDAIQDENARRSAVAKVLHGADATTMKKLCSHCRKRRGCVSFSKKECSWCRDEECVDGLIEWMYQDKEEQNDGQHDD